MSGGEYFVGHRLEIDPNSPAVPSDAFGELEAHVYTVATDDGPLAEVHIDVEGRFKGLEKFSVVTVRTLGSRAIGAAIERVVNPPLYDEPDRQAVVLDVLGLVDKIRHSGPGKLLDEASHPQELTV